MTPDGDKRRAQLLAQSVVLIFLLDDVWEKASTLEMVGHFRDEFVAILAGAPAASSTESPLQAGLREVRNGFLQCDREGGNGGKEVLQYLIEFCHHAPPTDFASVRDYLDYRFTWAMAKFSTRSTVDQNSPKFGRFLGYVGDQISIANDIASYEKEKRSYENGDADAMINVVHVIAKTEGLADEQAKCMAYAWQLWTESRIIEELDELDKKGDLSLEEWAFVDACLVAAAGNLLAAVVMVRYGGHKTRVALDAIDGE
ncbi:MAG: hypothetical protein Q9201_000390 [Fulgogasparrea decipioides]